MDVVRAQDLRVSLHRDGVGRQVLSDVTTNVAAGEIVALVGESGSGKSTLGLALQGLLDADADPVVEGSASVAGLDVVGAAPRELRELRRRRVGAVFQDPMTSLNPTMRVGAQLDEAADGEVPEDWLERVGIRDPARAVRSFPHQLSGGQRQRVMIAMAMMNEPALVIADEPTTALDVTVQAQILQLIRDLRDRSGTAFLFITHDLAVASTVADRLLVLYAGQLVEDAPIRQAIRAPAHPYTAALLDARFDLATDRTLQLPTLPNGDGPEAAPDACAFAPRCPLEIPACTASRPALAPVDDREGAAACIRSSEVTADLWRRRRAPWPDSAVRTPPEPQGPILSVAGVGRTYKASQAGLFAGTKEVVAVGSVDLEVFDGESVALVGESGSGKTTLLRMIAGLVEPSAGTIDLRGERRPQMVFQDAAASLTPWLKVREMLSEPLRIAGMTVTERSERIREVLDLVGIEPHLMDARPTQLSGGQAQRVAIARAICVPPPVLLCDEPVSAMDVSLAASILNLLGALQRKLGMAMVFVTHDIAAARFIADRVVVMRSGEVVEAGLAEQVVHEPQTAYTRDLLAAMPSYDGMAAG